MAPAMKPLPLNKGPFQNPCLKWEGNVSQSSQSSAKGNVPPWTRSGPSVPSLTFSHQPVPCLWKMKSMIHLIHISRLSSSMSDHLWQDRLRHQIDWGYLVMWQLGPNRQFPQQSHMRLPRGLRWMKRTSCGSSERALLVLNFWMSCRKPSASCRLMLRISNSQNHQSSLLHSCCNFRVLNGPISSLAPWLTSTTLYQEVLQSQVTTDRSKSLAVFNSNSVQRRDLNMSNLWEIGSLCGTCIPKQSLSLSPTGLVNYQCTHYKFLASFLPLLLNVTQILLTLIRQFEFRLASNATCKSQTTLCLKISDCICLTPLVLETLGKQRRRPSWIFAVRTLVIDGI